jgi:hypothetical protein
MDYNFLKEARRTSHLLQVASPLWRTCGDANIEPIDALGQEARKAGHGDVLLEAGQVAMSGYSTVLIAAGEGYLRDALRAMLVSMSGVMILEADDAVQAEVALTEHHPDLVIIDSALPGNHTVQLIVSIQNVRPRSRCSILVDNVVQQAAALRAGADRAPLKGEPAARLFAQVEQLLAPSGYHRATA